MDLQAANCKQIAPAPELLLQLRLYELFNNSKRSTFPGAEPPAGPEKVSKKLAESIFRRFRHLSSWTIFCHFYKGDILVG